MERGVVKSSTDGLSLVAGGGGDESCGGFVGGGEGGELIA